MFFSSWLSAQTCPDIIGFPSEVTLCAKSFGITNMSPLYNQFVSGALDAYTLDFDDGYVLIGNNLQGTGINGNIPANTNNGLTTGLYRFLDHTYCGSNTVILPVFKTYSNGVLQSSCIVKDFSGNPLIVHASCPCDITCDFDMVVATCHNLSVNFHANSMTGTHKYYFDGNLIETTNSQNWTYDFENFDNCSGAPISVLHEIYIDNALVCSEMKQLELPKGLFIGDLDCQAVKISDLIATGLFPANSYSSACPIYVYGELIIDQNYNFSGTTMFFDNGAGLTVGDETNGLTGELVINDGSSLSASCDGLWRGIRVYPNGVLSTEEALIKDALYAVRPMDLPQWPSVANNPQLNIKDTRLANNFIGLLAIDGRFDLDDFSDNNFSGGSILPIGSVNCPALMNDIASINYLVSNHSYAGIFIDGSPWYLQPHTNGAQLVVPASGQGNRFENLSCGINIRNASSSIHGCDFFDIDAFSYSTDAGVGIVSNGGSNFSVQNGHFTNVPLGIFGAAAGASLSSVSIVNTIMNNVKHGISIQSSQWGNYYHVGLRNNTINVIGALGYGVFIKDASPAGTIYAVESNQITINSNSSYGIWVLGEQGGMSGFFGPGLSTLGNVITLNSGATYSHGIFLNGATLLGFEENTINFNGATGSKGVSIEGGNHLTFQCNTVKQMLPATTGVVGFLVGQSDNFSIDHTDISNTTTGMQFSMPCAIPNNISQNHFGGSMDVGLSYSGSALIGAQVETGNVWSGTYAVVGANNNSGVFSANLYYAFTGNIQTPPTINPSSGWFFSGNLATITACVKKPPIGGIVQGLSDYQMDYIKGVNKSNQQGVDWETKKQILLAIDNSADPITDPNVMAFYNEQSALLEMIQVEKDIDQLFMISPVDELIINSLNTSISSLLDTLDTLDIQLKVAPNNKNLLTAYDQYQLTLSSKQAKLAGIWAQIIEARSANAKTIKSQLMAMTPQALPQSNEIKVWWLYLKFQAQQQALTSEELDELKTITGYCPEVGGAAVYFAADLYGVITGKALTIADCSKSTKNRDASVNIQKETLLSIYPNPGFNRLTIEQQGKSELTIQLMNLTGQVLKQQQSSDKKTTLNTTELPNGFYIIEVKSEDGQVNQSIRWLKTN